MAPIEHKTAEPTVFSVVIPAFNEAANIGKTLAALADQTFPRDRFEVIVVDNGSTDSTMAEAERFSSRLRLKVVSRPGCNISAVRNYGASLASGEILAFLDADCLAPADWLESSLALSPPRSIWGAHYLVQRDATWVGRVWFEFQATPQEGPVSFIPASNLFMRHREFDEIGGFNEELKTSEDVEISRRARKFGIEAIAFPRLAVFHEGTPRTLLHFYRQNRWHGTNVIRIFLTNLPSTKGLPLVAASFYILVMFWAALAIPVFALWRHHPVLAFLPLLLLLLPAILFSIWKTASSRRWRYAPPLFVLYQTYFLARAASVVRLSGRTHR